MQNYILFEEYTTLGQLLKELGLIATGGQAKIFLAENEGKIFYNGEAENRRGKKLYDGDLLTIPELDIEVKFAMATAEEIKEHEEEVAEEARVKAIVRKMNAENKATKAKKKNNPNKSFTKNKAKRAAQSQAPKFPGNK